MIEIKKSKEPYELLSYRKKAGANSDIDRDLNEILGLNNEVVSLPQSRKSA